jgi:hypothetical protein
MDIQRTTNVAVITNKGQRIYYSRRILIRVNPVINVSICFYANKELQITSRTRKKEHVKELIVEYL